MILTFEQVQSIVKDNPNKATITQGKTFADKLMLHLHGVGMESALKRCEYFQNEAVFKVQQQYAISNKDLFQRLLQQEDMIFSARGGSSHYNMSDELETQMNDLLSNVRYGFNLRKWVRNFALEAYRADPMGIIFMEVEALQIDSNGNMNEPIAYPTYKSIYCIHDYLTTGRRLEYVCFPFEGS
jgi:hypothetical protein